MPPRRLKSARIADHLILITGALFMILPAYALFSLTTHAPGAVKGVPLLPGTAALGNYQRLFSERLGFGGDITALGMVWNSFVLAAGFALAKVVLSLLAAYALVYFRVRFATAIFALLILTLMLPLESRFLATFDVVASLGLVNTQAGLILPLAASGIGTFFFRQFLLTVPEALLESARLDGAGPFRFLKDILVPLSFPVAGALFLVIFVNGWNQYLWPVMVTTDEAAYTVVRGLQFFGLWSQHGAMLAIVAMLPPALLVVLFQRQVIKGLFDGNH